MDVTCTRCGTVYEFEEGLVSMTGTTVKCTQCGHLFKVHRSAAPEGERAHDGDGPELRWRVRRVNGSSHMLESLTELTRLITAGQFTRDDEISRTGQVWKKLGDIHELASLFEPSAPVRARRPSEFSSMPPPPPAAALASAGDEPVHSSTPPPPPPPASPPAGEVSPRKRQRSVAGRVPVPAADVAVEAPGGSVTAPQAVELGGELETPVRARSRLGLVILIGVPLTVAAIAGALALRPSRPQPKPAATAVAPSARPFLQRADAALASHVPERFDEAISEYAKALAFHPDDAHILSSISRVYAVWSEWLGSRTRALQNTGGAASEIERLRVEARRLADQAKLYGERAAQRNPGNEEASVALSDALRLTGNLVAARAELDRARATEGVASAETLRVAALLAIEEAHGDLPAGRSFAQQSVASDPSLIRARLLLAQCLAAAGDLEGARMHVDAAVPSGAAHPIVEALRADLAQLERRAGPAPAEAPAEAPAPAPAEAEREDGAGVEQDAAKQVKREDGKREGHEASRRPQGDPDELVTKGENALERGAVQQAQRLFEDALAIQPGMARAKTGLGYVALERSQPRQAIHHFRPAAKNGNPEALIGLGDAYRRLGRVRDALDSYKEYMQRYPRGERRSIAQRQIELLGEQLETGP